MTFESDLQLQARGLQRVEDLPRRAGFEFIGVTRNGDEMRCYLRRNRKTDSYDVNFYDGGFADISERLIGWK